MKSFVRCTRVLIANRQSYCIFSSPMVCSLAVDFLWNVKNALSLDYHPYIKKLKSLKISHWLASQGVELAKKSPWIENDIHTIHRDPLTAVYESLQCKFSTLGTRSSAAGDVWGRLRPLERGIIDTIRTRLLLNRGLIAPREYVDALHRQMKNQDSPSMRKLFNPFSGKWERMKIVSSARAMMLAFPAGYANSAYYDMVKDAMAEPPEQKRILEEISLLARSIGVWFPYNRVCIVSDRPRKILLDEQGRLHSETGKAIEYSDGWGVSCWHGTIVPDDWITLGKRLTPEQVLQAQNVEQRAAGFDIIGWDKALDILQAKVIDSDPDPDHGDLIELTLPGLPQPERFLRAYCKRNGLIVEGVPRISDIDGKPIETVRAAQAWSFGCREDEFTYPDRVS